ncbi:SpoVG family protein [Planctopirus hydrillae]|uniref:Stage V sporulation protein G n=1 Tax=Planctopirus hydrillae TaxID=1841610 RepID=A0A1C3ELS5_9PLAN|nr:SpoVG family protein [Planctopirus hydrillae]ODA34179.1 stage V sporulation protein G [Planctopirus hydrillae]
MEITEIRIKLMDDPSERLQAFCSITLDGCFVIRDLKIIQGTRGSFVAMPSRKLMDRCPRCSCKNHLRARFCNDCGCELHEERASKADDGRAKLYADIAHPINSECRERIQANVIVAYSLELEKAKLPGYVCTYDDFGEENYATSVEEITCTPMVPHSVTTSTATATSSTATTSRPRHTFVNRVAQLEEEGFGSGLV